jgi:hypothetical protein
LLVWESSSTPDSFRWWAIIDKNAVNYGIEMVENGVDILFFENPLVNTKS